ncbi:TetR/AcrR family transcriptional regulator [Actinacidiphila acidipaludis]|uniref:TetR family transcriptional regulator n=1 Tax=Actinacidiphila acidipaludis TaxID=2873382 RepID=A0ABS7QD34_9ACTN|nr:TetR/AcrR family transcriptional regulator [Streptomyces acidipaludis]MBY8881078.1 TetR family transcriptional regulator [Streptomyces acidipaludis]
MSTEQNSEDRPAAAVAAPPPAPSRTQAERRALTEERLLDAAFAIVADRGVRAVTTAAVGERAGYSRGIVNHQFGSRDQLMVRLAETVQGRFTPAPEGRRGRAHVLNVVDDYLGTVRSDARAMRVFLRLWAAAVGDEEPGLSAAFTRRDAFFRDYLRDALAEGRADGSVRADIDPAATAVALVGLVRGIAMQCQVDPALASDDRVRAAALALIDHGLPVRG